jgi:hypothetical protein
MEDDGNTGSLSTHPSTPLYLLTPTNPPLAAPNLSLRRLPRRLVYPSGNMTFLFIALISVATPVSTGPLWIARKKECWQKNDLTGGWFY